MQSNFTQLRNDLYWSVYAGEDSNIRWSGYDDLYWWDNVAQTDAARKRIGAVTRRTFVLNHESGYVAVFD